MEYAHDFDAVIHRPVKHQVVAKAVHWPNTGNRQFRTNELATLANFQVAGQEFDCLFNGIEESMSYYREH